MRETGKALLATVAAGLGASAAKLIYDKKGQIKSSINKTKDNIELHNHYTEDVYSRLPKNEADNINKIVDLIMPANKGFQAQLNANRYLKVIKYLNHRYEFHIKDASRALNIPYNAVYHLTIALVEQNVLDYTKASQYYVRQPLPKHIFKLITPYYHNGIITPNKFIKGLKNILAIDMYQ